jgi:hypothetical protein
LLNIDETLYCIFEDWRPNSQVAGLLTPRCFLVQAILLIVLSRRRNLGKT